MTGPVILFAGPSPLYRLLTRAFAAAGRLRPRVPVLAGKDPAHDGRSDVLFHRRRRDTFVGQAPTRGP